MVIFRSHVSLPKAKGWRRSRHPMCLRSCHRRWLAARRQCQRVSVARDVPLSHWLQLSLEGSPHSTAEGSIGTAFDNQEMDMEVKKVRDGAGKRDMERERERYIYNIYAWHIYNVHNSFAAWFSHICYIPNRSLGFPQRTIFVNGA